MGLVRPILIVVVAMALAVYTFDCLTVATQEQAMQCCNSMHCSSHGHHGQDCCKTMPDMRAPFVQPPSVQGMSFPSVSLAVMPASDETQAQECRGRFIAVQCHAPPIFRLRAPVPIRI
jgi:hypothetical protein